MEPVEPSDEILRRFTSHEVNEEQATNMDTIRSLAIDLAAWIEHLTPPGRERAAAVNKIEEAVFHANAAISRPPSEHGRALTMEPPK